MPKFLPERERAARGKCRLDSNVNKSLFPVLLCRILKRIFKKDLFIQVS